MNVNWDDAQAFCAWLTGRERKAERLGATERYRLPSDHEWSCAVGIGEREDPAKRPDQKGGGIMDVFPWGAAWSPFPGAGNFSGEEAAGLAIRDEQEILAGYRDDFPYTAPVGSFAENPFGLFDLGGNIREFCEDWYLEEKSHVLRRASFFSRARETLLSCKRGAAVPDSPSGILGFRVVLAASVTPP